MNVVKEETKPEQTDKKELEQTEEPTAEQTIPLIPFSLNHPDNGKTYPVMRKVKKGNKQMFVHEPQLVNNDVVRMYNQLVKQFNNNPQVVQSGFISELNRLINWLRKQQLEAAAVEKLKAEANTPIPATNDNQSNIEEGSPVLNNADTSSAINKTNGEGN